MANSTAGTSNIQNLDGRVTFNGNATAANSTISNNGTLVFEDQSSGGNATIYNNGALYNYGISGNVGQFGHAIVDNTNAGVLDLGLAGTGMVTGPMQPAAIQPAAIAPLQPATVSVGALEGDGAVHLLNNTLEIVGNPSVTTATYNGTIDTSTSISEVSTLYPSDVGTANGKLLMNAAGTTQILNGNNASYYGQTEVQAGTLEIGDAADPTAALGGTITVDQNGILRGHGQIDGTVIDNGTVMPGGSIGALTINGNFTVGSNGVLAVEMTPNATAGTGYDQLIVTAMPT
jgi:fibronectin-binding autotransporter adhesin